MKLTFTTKNKLFIYLKLILFLTVFNVFSYVASAQLKELEDVSPEMLLNNQPYVDSTANAEILFESGKIDFVVTGGGLKYQFEVTRRIKIYNKEAYNLATVEIPYYYSDVNQNRERIKNIKAVTYYLDGDKVKSEKIKKKDVYDIELNTKVKAKKFTLPKINDGVIIEYTYTELSPHIRNLPAWKFQHSIPTLNSQFETLIPTEIIAYKQVSRGYHDINTESRNLKATIAGTNNAVNMVNTNHQVDYLEGIEKENYVNHLNNYISSVTYEVSSYRKSDGKTEFISKTWEDVVTKVRESKSYTKEIYETKYFEEDIDQLIGDLNTKQEKTEAIFDFVKNKVNWNKKKNITANERLKKVYELGEGNSAEVNLMLIAMLNYANVKTNPVLLSTIDNGIPIFPTISGLNYVIAKVDMEGNELLLDATDKNSSANLLPPRTLNWQGIELGKVGFQVVDLSPKNSARMNFNIMAQLNENAELSGQCRVHYFDQFALRARNNFQNTSEEKLIGLLMKSYSLENVSNLTQNNLNELQKPFIQSFAFTDIDNYVEQIGDKIYFSPLFFLATEKNPFLRSVRTYPVDFTYPKNQTYRILIDVPENFEIEHLPEKSIFKVADNLMSFSYNIQESNGKLLVEVSKDIAVSTLMPEYYTYLKKYYSDLVEKENEKIVLVRK